LLCLFHRESITGEQLFNNSIVFHMFQLWKDIMKYLVTILWLN